MVGNSVRTRGGLEIVRRSIRPPVRQSCVSTTAVPPAENRVIVVRLHGAGPIFYCDVIQLAGYQALTLGISVRIRAPHPIYVPPN